MAQDEPAQDDPAHEEPAQEDPAHDDEPAHEDPAHEEPFHVPPFQLVSVASCVACSVLLYALPKMSFSPERVTPPSTSLAAPRAPSRLPVPVETGNSCLAAGVGLQIAMFTFTKPLPWACSSAAGSVVAVLVSSALTWSGVSDGRCWSSTAAAPDTTAAACDVPLPRK